ncbi:hypothetical protein P7C73_g3412, partial [Tremellales sp. Uapishka_1]
MNEIQNTLELLRQACAAIKRFMDEEIEHAIYRAPVIDFHHPKGYQQTTVLGLKKFLTAVENETTYVESVRVTWYLAVLEQEIDRGPRSFQLVSSAVAPKDFTTNAPHILSVWEEFTRAQAPLITIAQSLDCGEAGSVKIDVVAQGGNEWIRVNTIKESRLLAEFREQDSYDNSDYDDSESESETAGPGPRPKPTAQLTNSIIVACETLLSASAAYPRNANFPRPKIKYVLSRLSDIAYRDSRIQETFDRVRGMGIELVIGGSGPASASKGNDAKANKLLRPTQNIMLDLSVVIALCCDSTHQPLPRTADELESRFRGYTLNESGERDLKPHSNVSRDLYDQLKREMQRPLVYEMKERLGIYPDIEFWITREVKDRLPSLINVIGGEQEKARARALFDGGGTEGSFWDGSRWSGDEGCMRNMNIRVVDETTTTPPLDPLDWFRKSLVTVCESMLRVVESDPTTMDEKAAPKSKHPKRSKSVFPQPTRLPSTHTLRTMIVGASRGMTILTNNRGAIGKVVREMGVTEGLPLTESDEAVLWVVNPSSLAEWRRIEVERENAALGD